MFDEEKEYSYYNNSYEKETSYYSTDTQEPETYYYGTAAPKKEKKNGFLTVLKVFAIALLFGVVAGGSIFGINYLGNKMFNTNNTPSTNNNLRDLTNVSIVSNESKFEDSSIEAVVIDVSDIVKAVMPSVVIIEGKAKTTNMFGQTSVSSVCGSGIIIGKNDTELLVVTNAHVVEGVDDLEVEFIDKTRGSATVKGLKTNKDLAVIAISLYDISDETISNISIAQIGNSESVQVGSAAIAIGNALGYGQSVTVGVISALNREVKVEGITHTLIQTDAAINPGNSGGALINAHGQVIGINSAKLTDTSVEGMGYAIPISSAMDIITELMNKETKEIVPEKERGYMGISGKDINEVTSAYLGYPQGVLVTKVEEDSAADAAGLQSLDILIGFDGESISTMEQLKKILMYYRAGETVEVEFYRQENDKFVVKTTEITLGKNE